jgi:hypothetical protein
MKINFRQIIKKQMVKLKIKNVQQLAAAINNYWLAAELKKSKGKLPANIQRITRQTIANYMAGRSELTAANLELLLEFLGINSIR